MHYDTYHFIGLGGIGMSALARCLLQKGHSVQGSDLASNTLLEELKSEGASIQIGHTEETIKNAGVVVYTSAINLDNVELKKAISLKIPLLHRSDLLNQLMQGKKTLLATGVHGKTTTTSLLISVLIQGGLDPSFVVGGVPLETRTNGRFGKGDYFIAEADESDGSFLKTAYFGAIVTNLEDEHLDYWKTREKLDQAFKQFFQLGSGLVFWCGDDEGLKNISPKGISYGFDPSNDLKITSFFDDQNKIIFDLEWEGKKYLSIETPLAGRHNALNAAAVFGLALKLQIKEEDIRKALASFQGTCRRLEHKGSCFGIDIWDDYGHHPTEIKATLKALRARVKERRIVAIFQPHRYTRVKDQFFSFLDSFDDADVIVMTEIYAAGESPIEGITSAFLYAKMKEKLGARLYFFPRSQLELGVSNLIRPHDAVITLGAGDVTKVGDPLLHLLKERAPKLKVGIAFGGKSAEHPVSLRSARTVLNAIDSTMHEITQFGVTKEGDWIVGDDALEKLEKGVVFSKTFGKLSFEVLEKLKTLDVMIPVFHGPKCEDGMMQSFFELLEIPYASCDYRSSVICMHKAWTKQVAIQSGVPTASFVSFQKGDEIKNPFPYPVWVKPVHLGSSFGVSRAENEEAFQQAVKCAFSFDDEIIVEKEIVGKQIEFGIYGNEHLEIASCEILNEGAFCGYDQKYGSNAYPYAVPPNIPKIDLELGSELAKTMYKASGCKVLARIDFFYDGHFWFNEINPFPGLTLTSAYPEMWKKSGVSMKQICNWLVILSMHKQRGYKV